MQQSGIIGELIQFLKGIAITVGRSSALIFLSSSSFLLPSALFVCVCVREKQTGSHIKGDAKRNKKKNPASYFGVKSEEDRGERGRKINHKL